MTLTYHGEIIYLKRIANITSSTIVNGKYATTAVDTLKTDNYLSNSSLGMASTSHNIVNSVSGRIMVNQHTLTAVDAVNQSLRKFGSNDATYILSAQVISTYTHTNDEDLRTSILTSFDESE